ncbi:Origin recognition complex subunit 2 [Pseudocercospora fuligena]|uniref:Origin recognition complex subunit 2 n=1 Tax=Pseudocercospora fuligena TaxID=685502 RepID=A0A8H6VG63_9PEZI|nr:Origin recognition complex subunit 2 [Pseudocercospora fuligena]
MPKRRKTDDAGDAGEDDDPTPRKTRRSAKDDTEPAVSSPSRTSETPSKRKSILKDTPTKANGLKSVEATPSSLRKVLFSTPYKEGEEVNGDNEDTPTASRNDRSARRKSQRTLQKQIVQTEDSDAEDDAQEEAIAQAILGEGDGDDDEEDEEGAEAGDPATPSKTGRPRGRPKGRRRERTPSPPPDMPPHELYFFQNRAGGNKTSANTMPTHLLLNHEDYFAQMNAYKDPHDTDMKMLRELHARAYDQWIFELEESFNLCFYGYGSKRDLLMDFAEHMYYQSEKPPKIVIVNGYTPGLTIRDALSCLAGVVVPKNTKLPAQPAAMLDLLSATLTESPPKHKIVFIIHSLDHANLRKTATQTLIARLASHPSISLLASCDTPNFPLLWDVSLSSQLRFLYHDATTFAPYTAEIEVVEDVNALLGRSSRRLGGKDGVGYVLKSLPENARSLFRILVAEQLALADTEGDAVLNGVDADSDPEGIIGAEDDDEAAAEQQTPSRRGRGRPAKAKTKPVKTSAPVQHAPSGIEYRTLYHKAVEEFVCSSEVNFRTLLKEFHDHQMIESRKDGLGTERLIVPFRREELESILEELV